MGPATSLWPDLHAHPPFLCHHAGSQPGGRYRPPHSRRQSQAQGGSDGQSDSDASSVSDAEQGGAAAADRNKSSRVRLSALMCLQARRSQVPAARKGGREGGKEAAVRSEGGAPSCVR